MITYEYDCPKCGIIEIEHSIKTKKKKCPICKSKIERLISAPYFIDLTPKTVGSFAERQSKKMGRYGLQEAQHKREVEQEQQREKALQEVEKKLPAGMKIPRIKKKQDDLPKDVKTALETGNSKRVEKFIMEGR